MSERSRPVVPFPRRADVQFRKRLEHWEVGYRCRFSGTWHWEWCKAARRPSAVKEVPALLIKLIRDSADRWNKAANEALDREIELRREASELERATEQKASKP